MTAVRIVVLVLRMRWLWRVLFGYMAVDMFLAERWAPGLLWLFGLILLMLLQIEGEVRDLRRRQEGSGT